MTKKQTRWPSSSHTSDSVKAIGQAPEKPRPQSPTDEHDWCAADGTGRSLNAKLV